jgi:hypothetical protein
VDWADRLKPVPTLQTVTTDACPVIWTRRCANLCSRCLHVSKSGDGGSVTYLCSSTAWHSFSFEVSEPLGLSCDAALRAETLVQFETCFGRPRCCSRLNYKILCSLLLWGKIISVYWQSTQLWNPTAWSATPHSASCKENGKPKCCCSESLQYLCLLCTPSSWEQWSAKSVDCLSPVKILLCDVSQRKQWMIVW